jgi:tRNA (guanine-N7-)-methyltransferase
MPRESGAFPFIMAKSDIIDPKRAFFGRRKGHALRPRQTALFETLLPRVAIDTDTEAPADLRTLFPVDVNEVRLEIGFGGGEHLLAQAVEHPRVGFIGSDAFVNAVAKVLAGIQERELGNLRLHSADAAHLMDWLPPSAISRLDLLYPDPWPKKRHWKRRFVQDASVRQIARVLRPGGEFRFATDIPGYAAWTLERVLRSPDFIWTAEKADDWRKPWPGFGGTRYEAKAMREGRVPAYFVFRRR